MFKKAALFSVSLGLLAACNPVPNVINPGAQPMPPVMPTAMPEPMPEPTAMPSAEPAPALMDIVDTAVAAGSFNTLAQALTAANLVDTLKGEGPFTVFAPTDAAFAALPEGALDNLLANPEELARVLTYHVVAGRVDAATVTGLSEAATVAGPNVAIEVVDGMVKINDATVTTADVMASNGIIHVIDTVLLPPAAN